MTFARDARVRSAFPVAFACALFGACVGLGNAFLIDHHTHQHGPGADGAWINCVFCLPGVAPPPAELPIATACNNRAARPAPGVRVVAPSPRTASLQNARAPPA
ncbi:MAG: hypothetical protein P8Y95_15145 [Gammaproteobacteria bacterium]|jgi:hypothetical protein